VLRLGQFEGVQYLLPIEMKLYSKSLANVLPSDVDNKRKNAIRSVVPQHHTAKNFAGAIPQEQFYASPM
jgi:hypothetical protein